MNGGDTLSFEQRKVRVPFHQSHQQLNQSNNLQNDIISSEYADWEAIVNYSNSIRPPRSAFSQLASPQQQAQPYMANLSQEPTQFDNEPALYDNHLARKVSFANTPATDYTDNTKLPVSANTSAETAISYYQSPPEEAPPPPVEDTLPDMSQHERRHSRSRSKDFAEVYGRHRVDLTPSVFRIPRRPNEAGPSGSANSEKGGSKTSSINELLSSGHKMPPFEYMSRYQYKRAAASNALSIGINGKGYGMATDLDDYDSNESSDESMESDHMDHYLEDCEEKPENDPWLKKWKYNDPEVCCICLDSGTDEDNAFVYCDNPECEVIVHQACYAIVNKPGPEDTWFCDRCAAINEDPALVVSCVLCPIKHGAFRRLDESHKVPGWIHVVCGTWMPNVQIGNENDITGFDIREIPNKNWKSKCYLCADPISASHGACVRCDAHGCKKTFHVSCAQKFSLLEEEIENADKMADPYFMYCLGHCSEHQGEARLNEWEKWVRQRDRYLMMKNEEAAERRCNELWQRAQRLTQGNDNVTVELIRSGFGFRELVSDRYATFANDMSNAIAISQSAVLQLESQNFQLEEGITRMDSSLKDVAQKIKRYEKRRVELQKEINKVTAQYAREDAAESRRRELEGDESSRRDKAAYAERRKVKLMQRISRVTAEIAREEATRRHIIEGHNQKTSAQHADDMHSSRTQAHPRKPSVLRSNAVMARPFPARLGAHSTDQSNTFSFPPIISAHYYANNDTRDSLNDSNEQSSKIEVTFPATPPPTSTNANTDMNADIASLTEADIEGTIQTESASTTQPTTATDETTAFNASSPPTNPQFFEAEVGYTSGEAPVFTPPEDSLGFSKPTNDTTTAPTSVNATIPVKGDEVNSTSQDAETSNKSSFSIDDDIMTAARIAIRNGKRLMMRAQSMTNSIADQHQRVPPTASLSTLAEKHASSASSTSNTSEVVAKKLKPSKVRLPPMDHGANEYGYIEFDHPVSPIRDEFNLETLEINDLTSPSRLHNHDPVQQTRDNAKPSTSPRPLTLPIKRQKIRERTHFPLYIKESPLYIRESPLTPQKQIQVSVENPLWLSEVNTDGSDEELVTEYTPVIDFGETSEGESQLSPRLPESSKHPRTNIEQRSGSSRNKANMVSGPVSGNPTNEAPSASSQPISQISGIKIRIDKRKLSTLSTAIPPPPAKKRKDANTSEYIHSRSDSDTHVDEPDADNGANLNGIVSGSPPKGDGNDLDSNASSPRIAPLKLIATLKHKKKDGHGPHRAKHQPHPGQSNTTASRSTLQPLDNAQTERRKQAESTGKGAAMERKVSNRGNGNNIAPATSVKGARNATQSTNATGTQAANTAPPAPPTPPAPRTDHLVCTTCSQREPPQSVIKGLGISAKEMKYIMKIRPSKHFGHTGRGKDWDPGALIECETCKRHFHSGCTDPPVRNYPQRGVQFRCVDCDEVKIFQPDEEMNKKDLVDDKKNFRKRANINYHE